MRASGGNVEVFFGGSTRLILGSLGRGHPFRRQECLPGYSSPAGLFEKAVPQQGATRTFAVKSDSIVVLGVQE